MRKLIYFDCRENFADISQYRLYREALESSEESFGYRLDVVKWRTCDSYSWSSVFEDTSFQPNALFYPWQRHRVPLPSSNRSFRWEDLDEMRHYMTLNKNSFCYPFWEVAVFCEEADFEGAPYDFEFKPSMNPDTDWVCLGFDVSERGGLSALTSFGIETEEQRRIGQSFGVINEHHLFDDYEAAKSFADWFTALLDQPHENHGPFFVFSIWKIREYSNSREVKSSAHGSISTTSY